MKYAYINLFTEENTSSKHTNSYCLTSCFVFAEINDISMNQYEILLYLLVIKIMKKLYDESSIIIRQIPLSQLLHHMTKATTRVTSRYRSTLQQSLISSVLSIESTKHFHKKSR